MEKVGGLYMVSAPKVRGKTGPHSHTARANTLIPTHTIGNIHTDTHILGTRKKTPTTAKGRYDWAY